MTLTARTLLAGEDTGSPVDAGPAQPGWRAIRDRVFSDSLRRVSAAGREVVEREVASAIDGILRVDIGEIVIGGWRKHSSLLHAARLTRDDPLRTETVALATHQITVAHRPYVEVVVNGVSLARVHCDLGITLEIAGVVAIVNLAQLVAVQGGGMAASISLGCEGVELVSRRVVGIDPMLAVALGSGIALLRDDHSPAPA